MRSQTWRWRNCFQQTRAWTLRVLVIAGLLLPTFGDIRPVSAQEIPAGKNEPFSLAFVPRDAVALVAARPAVLLSRPVFAPLRQALLEQAEGSFRLGVKLEAMVETSLFVLPTDRGFSPVALVRLESPDAARQVIASLGQNAQPAKYAETTYYRVGRSAYFQPDPLTIIVSPDAPGLIRCMAAGPKGAATTNWATKWSSVASLDAAAIVNTSLLRAIPQLPIAESLLQMGQNRNARSNPSTSNQLAPLWQRSENIVVAPRFSNEIVVRLVSESATSDEAQQVQSAMLTTVALARTVLSQGRLALATRAEETTPVLMAQLDLVDEILEKAQIVRQQDQVGLTARADAQVTQQLVKAAVPTVLSAQRVAYRTKSMNNLRQIALAFHNYHDTYKRFPAAVQIGPKNIPHSPRVTILPFLDGSPLYDIYRQDEPWDSEHNKQVLARMPEVYRSPSDAVDSTNTSYFVLQGSGTVFDGNRASRFADVLDGTSNTMLAVESRLPVPWTKPQELQFDPEGPLPAIGGWYPDGFCAAMCDGRSLFVPKDYSQLNLRRLFTRADGSSVKPPDARR